MPADAVDHDEIATLRQKVSQYKGVTQIIRKQRSTGAWGSNILGVGASKALGIKEIGTISQYRRLLEMGVRPTDRVFQLANRLFFRLLSRDDDPKLLFEYRKSARTNPDVANWARGEMHEAATAALTHSGQIEDPRVRGAAQRVANALSHFLRSDLAEKPIIKKGARYILHPDAHPPSLYSVALIAYMPNLQRERADFIERFVQFITQPAPKKAFVIMVGSKGFKPTTQILGDPLQNDPTMEGDATLADLNMAIFEGVLSVENAETVPTKAEAATFIAEQLPLDAGMTLLNRMGLRVGGTGVVSAVHTGDSRHGAATYIITIEGTSLPMYSHGRVANGPVDLLQWQGRTVGRSFVRGEGHSAMWTYLETEQIKELVAEKPTAEVLETPVEPPPADRTLLYGLTAAVVVLGLALFFRRRRQG